MILNWPGLVYRLIGQFEKSLENFIKLQAVLRHQPDILFQIGKIHEEMGNDEQSIEWFEFFNSRKSFKFLFSVTIIIICSGIFKFIP